MILLGLVEHRARRTCIGGDYDYREGVSVWYRVVLPLHTRPRADGRRPPLGFQLHALVAIALFALWPFTRLVHVFSAPLGYLTRPYIVYRSRDDPSWAATGRAAAGTGWAEHEVAPLPCLCPKSAAEDTVTTPRTRSEDQEVADRVKVARRIVVVVLAGWR